jgi:hypothetical protein
MGIYIFKYLPIIIGTQATIDLIKKNSFSKDEFDNSKYIFFLNVNVIYSWGKYHHVGEIKTIALFFNDKC